MCSWCRVTFGGRSNSTRGMRRDVSVLSDCQIRARLHSTATNTLTSATLRSLETLLLLTEEWDIDYKMLMLRGGWGVLRYCQVVIMEDSSLWNKLLWLVLLVYVFTTWAYIESYTVSSTAEAAIAHLHLLVWPRNPASKFWSTWQWLIVTAHKFIKKTSTSLRYL